MIRCTHRKFLYLFLLVMLGFTGCKKTDKSCAYRDSPQVARAEEISFLQDYVSNHSLDLIQHPSGVFYRIDSTGTGATPNVCSIIRVKYTGRLLNGTVVDYNNSTTGASFTLGGLLKGWQMLLPLIKPGGTMTLLIPPSLAYGSQTIFDEYNNVLIPPGSFLMFDISLLDVQ